MPTEGPTIQIRPATRRDIAAIVAAHNTSVPEDETSGFGTPRSAQTFADSARLRAAWRAPNRVGGEEVLVAELDGVVVGYCAIEDRGRFLELVNVDVAAEHQRRGVGGQLVRAVEDRARAEGREAVTLGTSRNGAGVPWRSFPWWRSLGYHVTHEEENAWTRAIGPGTREIRMRKDMRPAEGVTLRPVDETDLALLFEWQRDLAASRMAAFTVKEPSDWNAFQAHWARIRSDGSITMRAVLLEGHLVGTVGSFLDPEFGHLEVTYWIGREFWGRGFATLALKEFLRQFPTRPIYARAAADNVASVRVLEKCGFVLVGRSRGYASARGAEVDQVILKLEASTSG